MGELGWNVSYESDVTDIRACRCEHGFGIFNEFHSDFEYII